MVRGSAEGGGRTSRVVHQCGVLTPVWGDMRSHGVSVFGLTRTRGSVLDRSGRRCWPTTSCSRARWRELSSVWLYCSQKQEIVKEVQEGETEERRHWGLGQDQGGRFIAC